MVLMSPLVEVFQFTHPGKGATVRDVLLFCLVLVSIHAPWEGCDRNSSSSPSVMPLFQFTHPGKGATVRDVLLFCLVLVSIHAPWEGCDRNSSSSPSVMPLFQFTHPGKGATFLLLSDSIECVSFNSRTLGRVRLLKE